MKSRKPGKEGNVSTRWTRKKRGEGTAVLVSVSTVVHREHPYVLLTALPFTHRLTSPPSTSRGRHLLPASNPVGQQVDWCSGTEMTESLTPCQDPHPSFSAPQASRQGLMLQELAVSSGHCCGQPTLSSLPVSSQRKMYQECSSIRRSTSPNSRWSG